MGFPQVLLQEEWVQLQNLILGWVSIGTLYSGFPLHLLFGSMNETLKGFGLDTMTLLFSLFSSIFAVFTILFTYSIQ